MPQKTCDQPNYAHTQMALRMLDDGKAIQMTENLDMDITAYKLSQHLGDDSIFAGYVAGNYDASADYWKLMDDGTLVNDGSGWLTDEHGRAIKNKEGKQIGSFIEKLAKGFDEREYRMKLTGEDFTTYGKNVLAQFEARAINAGYAVAPNSYEGVRISFHSDEVQGWLLLRLSLHDPLMPLNMEGVRPGDCEKMVEIVRELLAGFDELDVI